MQDDRRLHELVGRLRVRFGWEEDPEGLVVEEQWASHTSVLYKLVRPGGAVVLKVGREWTADRAREVYEDLRRLESLLAAEEEVRIAVPGVLGWDDDPPSICLRYVAGEDLGRLLRRREGYRSPLVERAVEQCGAALGLFHTAEADAAGEVAPIEEDRVRRRLRRMARQLLLKAGVVESMAPGLVVSRRYGDFAPYNIRITDGGSVWLLDHPSSY